MVLNSSVFKLFFEIFDFGLEARLLKFTSLTLTHTQIIASFL